MDEDGWSRARAGERWFAVNSQPKREWRAQAQLVNQGFRVFMPKRLKTVRHARKLTTVLAPLFPRYLFVALDLAQHRWRSVNGTFGVCSLVMVGERPQPVPRGVVEAMIAATDSEGRLVFIPILRLAPRSVCSPGHLRISSDVLTASTTPAACMCCLRLWAPRFPCRCRANSWRRLNWLSVDGLGAQCTIIAS